MKRLYVLILLVFICVGCGTKEETIKEETPPVIEEPKEI